ncbi:MAG: ABC transporter permease [Candidatus Poribacteria bacterium]|nr:MAG: ABC transporter permease [Candidatus Poribacteria bacterium]
MSPRLRRAARNPYLILLVPALVWLVVFFLIPLGMVFLYSFQTRNPDGTIAWTFQLGNYLRLLRPLQDEFPPNYVVIILRSLWMAALTTFLCLLIGYPFAYGLARSSLRWRNTLVLLVVIPFWTNFLIRTYAWRFLLWRRGLFDTLAQGLGLGEFVLHGTPTAVVIGLVYGYLPFMILPLYITLERMDRSLIEAAYDLGASPWRAFWRVTVPLSRPGIIAGSVLVFIPSASAFVTPKLLGGAKSMMLGELVEMQFKAVRDWPFGSAAGFVLMALVLLLVALYFRAVGAEEF